MVPFQFGAIPVWRVLKFSTCLFGTFSHLWRTAVGRILFSCLLHCHEPTTTEPIPRGWHRQFGRPHAWRRLELSSIAHSNNDKILSRWCHRMVGKQPERGPIAPVDPQVSFLLTPASSTDHSWQIYARCCIIPHPLSMIDPVTFRHTVAVLP